MLVVKNEVRALQSSKLATVLWPETTKFSVRLVIFYTVTHPKDRLYYKIKSMQMLLSCCNQNYVTGFQQIKYIRMYHFTLNDTLKGKDPPRAILGPVKSKNVTLRKFLPEIAFVTYDKQLFQTCSMVKFSFPLFHEFFLSQSVAKNLKTHSHHFSLNFGDKLIQWAMKAQMWHKDILAR